MVSSKCEAFLSSLDKKDTCPLPSDRRKFVGCKASELRDKQGMKFGDSVRAAWKMVKERCK